MKDYLLHNKTAKDLYKHIVDLPIIDYHNHIDPKEIYENKPFTNITDMWLEYDHYKWRLMRFSGLSSHEGDRFERFHAFAKSIETAYLNPVKDWAQMELSYFFQIEEELTSKNAKTIYQQANTYLQEHPFGPRDLLRRCKVEALCTTDDITSDLVYHQKLKDDTSFHINVLPTFRPDRLFTTNYEEFRNILTELGEITTLDNLEQTLLERLDFFEQNGCVLADHGITTFVYKMTTKQEASVAFKHYLENNISKEETVMLHSYLLHFLMIEYKRRNWTVQFHLGALRNTNAVGFKEIGKDAGYDSISGHNYTKDLTAFLNDVNSVTSLPRMILYPLNSNHYEELAGLCASFSRDKEGHLQLGAAWWFHDQVNGIRRQLDVFSSYLNIGHFVGMLTDSRSFLSFIRHDYFRRILCTFIGENVENGRIQTTEKQLQQLLTNIAYQNSKTYLGI